MGRTSSKKAGSLGAKRSRSRGKPQGRRPPLEISVTKADPTRLGISDIPGELRNMIYNHALSPPNNEAIHLNGGPASRIASNLLASCKAVGKESFRYLFPKRTFRLDVVPGNYSSLKLRGLACHYARTPEGIKLSRSIPKRVGSVRRFILAYQHPTEDYYVGKILVMGPPKAVVKMAELEDLADVSLELQLLPRMPHYTLTRVDCYETDAALFQEVIKACRPFLDKLLVMEGKRCLTKADVLELVDLFEQSCRRHVKR